MFANIKPIAKLMITTTDGLCVRSRLDNNKKERRKNSIDRCPFRAHGRGKTLVTSHAPSPDR